MRLPGVRKVNQDRVCDFRTNSCSRFSLVIPLFSLTHGYGGSLIITKPQAKPSSFFTAQEETCKSLPQKKNYHLGLRRAYTYIEDQQKIIKEKQLLDM